MRPSLWWRLLAGAALLWHGMVCAAAPPPAGACSLSGPGATVEDPPEARSSAGALRIELTLRSQRQPDGSERYCYLTPDGRQSPTLRVRPGDEITVRFRNGLAPSAPVPAAASSPAGAAASCRPRAMTPVSSNLHFHGLTVPAVCGQDDVLRTLVEPGDAPFEYRFRIPPDAPPGLYWYHAHAHGLAARQVGGGASGALIVESGGAAVPAARGLPERILVIRDQPLLNPDAPPSRSQASISPARRDRDGDAGNSGTGYGRPARDLTVNNVPVPYPAYPPATLVMRPRGRELWRLVNASSVTYLNVALLVRGVAQPLEVVGVDGVPVAWRHPGAPGTRRTDHLGIPPGARMEFVVQAPEAGTPALMVTRAVDTGPDGENDPDRPLLNVVAQAGRAIPAPVESAPAPEFPRPQAVPWIGDVLPARTRRFYFWETPADPAHPEKPAAFYLVEEGRPVRAFDPAGAQADVVVRQGDVEDWVIENRTRELHAFHVHQLHFQVRDWFGMPVNEPFVRDTINVPFYDFQMSRFPSVTLRMDFRAPATIGTFVYHCHLLDHEDAGMMGKIRVETPAPATADAGDVAGAAWNAGRRWLHSLLTEAGVEPPQEPPASVRAGFNGFCRASTNGDAAAFPAPRARDTRRAPSRSEAPLTPAARAPLADFLGLLPGPEPIAH
jgi:FtsP/CotA-like multicopper oxidase with cupredoxin domain